MDSNIGSELYSWSPESGKPNGGGDKSVNLDSSGVQVDILLTDEISSKIWIG